MLECRIYIAIENSRRAPGRDGKTLSYHRQDDNVEIGGISNMGLWGLSAVSGIERKKNIYIYIFSLRVVHGD